MVFHGIDRDADFLRDLLIALAFLSAHSINPSALIRKIIDNLIYFRRHFYLQEPRQWMVIRIQHTIYEFDDFLF